MMRGAFNHPFDWASPFFLYAEGDMPSYCWKTRLKVAMLPKPDCPAMDVIESSVRSRKLLAERQPLAGQEFVERYA